jgi:hypothetical protein
MFFFIFLFYFILNVVHSLRNSYSSQKNENSYFHGIAIPINRSLPNKRIVILMK